MPVQSTYTENLRPAVAGQMANMEPVKLISRTIEDADGVGFGAVVQQGSADETCTKDLNTVPMTAQRFLGITVRERSVRPETPNSFGQRESVRIMREGVIWVTVAGAVTPAGVPTVTLATGVIGVAAVGAGVVAIPNARWESSTAGAGLAKLRLAS